MYETITQFRTLTAATLLFSVFTLASCASTPPPCNGPQTKNLNAAISEVKTTLNNGIQVFRLRSIAGPPPGSIEQAYRSPLEN